MGRKSLVSVCLAIGVLAGTILGGSLLKGQNKAIPDIPKEMTTYRDVVQKVLPAVVSIERRFKPALRQRSHEDHRNDGTAQLPEEMRKFFEEFSRQPFRMPQTPQQHGFGSGFLIDANGVIVTNHHVVAGADEVQVQLRDGRKFISKNIKSDPKTDLAIVRIEAKEPLPYLTFGDSTAMEIGDRVLAVGAPFGLTGTVTSGIISAKGRNLHMNMYEDFLQTDAAINPGNSGGPLVNLRGEVIGVNSAIKSQSGGWQGVGLAIASDLARNVCRQLLADGVVHRGYLGVQIKPLDSDKQKGVRVAKVFETSPAAKAGLKDGDVITGLGGKPVASGHDLQSAVSALPLDKPVSLSVLRDGERKELSVTIREQPADFGLVRAPANEKE